MDWVLKKSDAVACPVLNHGSSFPVNNIYCVGRNYSEHAKEMGGNPDRELPFFFHKISEILFTDLGKIINCDLPSYSPLQSMQCFFKTLDSVEYSEG